MNMKLGSFAARPIRKTCAPSTSFVLPYRMIGIEIELENYPGNTDTRVSTPENDRFYGAVSEFWKMKLDGSLRNNGREFVSEPLIGEDITSAIERFSWAVKNFPSITFGVRTSVHVHVDVRDLTLNQLRSIIYTYVLLERLIYSGYFPSRESNVFCVPLYAEKNMQQTVRNLLQYIIADNERYAKSVFSKIGRYCGLNLAAVIKYATLEFRHCSGTANPDILYSWINLIMGIVKAKKFNADYILDICKEPGSARMFLEDLYGKHYGYLLGSYLTDDLLESGITDLSYLSRDMTKSHVPEVSAEKSLFSKHRKITLKKGPAGNVAPNVQEAPPRLRERPLTANLVNNTRTNINFNEHWANAMAQRITNPEGDF